MMAQQVPTLRRPLAQIVSALIVLWTILAGTFWLADMLSISYQGHFNGSWYIDAADFRASVYTQIALSLAAIGAGIAWAVTAILRRRDLDPRITCRLAAMLITVIIAFLALYSAHRWFEVIICAKGSIPSECGL